MNSSTKHTLMKLSEIEQLIHPLMQNYIAAREKMIDSEIPIINQIHKYVQAQKGKQLRPMLTLLTACCCGLTVDANPNHPIFKSAAAIETLHTSTLIHDDVIDESELRRGIASVNKLWNNKTAVLIGDFYLAQVMKTINDIDNKQLTQTINDAVIQMSEGELLQMQQCGKYTTEADIYFQIITRKTAILIATCCKTGALLAGADKNICEAALQFGTDLGIAFQIRDDIIDFLPSQQTGKPQGNDIYENKCTLPMILALKDTETYNAIFPILYKEKKDRHNIDFIINIITNNGFIEKAKQILYQKLDNAINDLNKLPDNIYRHALCKTVSFLKDF